MTAGAFGIVNANIGAVTTWRVTGTPVSRPIRLRSRCREEGFSGRGSRVDRRQGARTDRIPCPPHWPEGFSHAMFCCSLRWSIAFQAW
jgi:hypothetical protein